MDTLKEKLFENNIYHNAYLLCIFIVMLLRGFSITSNSITYYVLFAIGTVCLLFKIYSDKWKLKESLFIIASLVVIIINYYTVKETLLIFSFFLLLGLKNINVDKILQIILIMSVASYLYIIGGHLLGYFPEVTIEMWRVDHMITRNLYFDCLSIS